MSENKELHEENLNKEGQENLQNEQNTTESVTEQPTAEELLAEEKDRYVRLYAEFENYKKRTLKEKMEFAQYANTEMMIAMLSILDDFERAISTNETATEIESVKEGFLLIYNKYKGILESKGLKPMHSKGEVFDSEFHEAIANIPADSDEMKGKIIDDVEKGYTLHDKVVRFAKVVVGQ